MTARTVSLRNRLLVWIALPVLVGTLVISVGAFWASWQEIEEVYDAQLGSLASVLIQLTKHELLDHDEQSITLAEEDPNLQYKYSKNAAFRIWHAGKLVAESQYAKTFEPFTAPEGFSDQKINHHTWRVFIYIDPTNDIRIETSERYSIRYELVRGLMGSLLLPALLLVPLIFMLVWFGARRSLQPLVELLDDLDRRSSHDLSPIRRKTILREVMPFVQALNNLFARLEESFKREREFTDHAAHELRTPLAAMKTQTQVLLKKASKAPAWKSGLTNLHSSINRATRMVEQLLALARLQHQDFLPKSTNLTILVEDTARELRPLAKEKGVSLTLHLAPNTKRDLDNGAFTMLFYNLLDNAIKYTPAGGYVEVNLKNDGTLSIADSGPGLSRVDKERVFERFVRVDKTGQPGSGLGLAIVKWIADAQDATVELSDNQPHGLIATVSWRS